MSPTAGAIKSARKSRIKSYTLGQDRDVNLLTRTQVKLLENGARSHHQKILRGDFNRIGVMYTSTNVLVRYRPRGEEAPSILKAA